MATYTVTATQSTNAAGGMALQVLALDNAVLAGTPATATSTTAYNALLTTTQAGSFVYGCAANGGAATGFTAEPLCTLYSQYADTTNGCEYGFWSTTSGTGTPGSTLVGFSTTYNTLYGVVGMEILASGGTLAVEGTSPAVIGSGTLNALTTASFTPTTASMLVAMVVTNGNAAGAPVVDITNTGGTLTWVPGPAIGATAVAGFHMTVAMWTALTGGVSTTASAGLATGAGAGLTATTLPQTSLAGPAYATSATDLGGVYGSWGTPQFAQGGP